MSVRSEGRRAAETARHPPRRAERVRGHCGSPGLGDVGHGTWCGATKLSLRLESRSLAAFQKKPTAYPASRDIPAGLPVCPVLPVPGQCDGPGQRQRQVGTGVGGWVLGVRLGQGCGVVHLAGVGRRSPAELCRNDGRDGDDGREQDGGRDGDIARCDPPVTPGPAPVPPVKCCWCQ